MNNCEHIYPNRFNTDYLKNLLTCLSIEELKKTALDIEKIIKGKKYKKCINIDFCGLAATTLFNSNADDLTNITKDNIEVRQEITAAFKNIFTRKNLLLLNNDEKNGPFYLRVRFCLSYLYSDYPICLIKAEDNDVWENLADKPVDDYYINKPIDKGFFGSSDINIHQIKSLQGIVKILTENKDLIFLGGQEKKENTIQLRFSVIPSPICTLIINNTAFCDPYTYFKKSDNLSLIFPVVILPKNDSIMGRQFEAVRRHVDYLWRHDLTLFCKDATEYDPEDNNIGGIVNVLTPDKIAWETGTNWKHKEERIWEKIQEVARIKGSAVAKDYIQISKWKRNLNQKFANCTRKIEEKNVEQNTLSIAVGMKRKFYHFIIKLPEKDIIFEYLMAKPTLIFIAVAHYSYAVLEDKLPILHTCCNMKFPKLISELKEQLNLADLTKKDAGSNYFDLLFAQKDGLSINAFSPNISFDYDCYEEINNLKYNTHYYTLINGKRKPEKKGCLDFSLKKST